MEVLPELSGWIGAGSILLAYFLNSYGVISVCRLYQSLNLLGACGVVVNSAYHGAWPPAGLNTIWFVIALTALVRLIKRSEVPAGHAHGSGRASLP